MNTPTNTSPEATAGSGTETYDDVRKFLGTLSNRSCEEAIGLDNQGGLVSGMVQATLGFAVVLVAFTAIPYWMGSEKQVPIEQPPAVSAAPNENSVAPPEQTNNPAGESDVDLSKAAEVMGIDETKTAAPNENPLDNKLDNLLDGVD